MLNISSGLGGHILYCREWAMKKPASRMRNMFIMAILGLAVLAVLEPVMAYEGDPSVAGVTVSGRVLYTGPLPKPERVPVYRDSKYCGETVSIDKIQVERPSGGISDVVISVEGISRGKPIVPEKTVISFQNNTCRFVPRISVAVVGNVLEILNTDPILHNTHIRVDNRLGPTIINVVQPAGVDVIIKPLQIAGFFDIRCDAHTFMQASIHVFDHPYYALTDKTGHFEMAQVPPGTYRLRMWHEAVGARTKTITVPQSGSLTLDLAFGPEE
jgi:Polysaccharide lyase family 4, domain II